MELDAPIESEHDISACCYKTRRKATDITLPFIPSPQGRGNIMTSFWGGASPHYAILAPGGHGP
jgi:hypothetical protein